MWNEKSHIIKGARCSVVYKTGEQSYNSSQLYLLPLLVIQQMTGGSVAAPEPVPALFIIPDRGLHGLKCSSQKMTLKYLETQ